MQDILEDANLAFRGFWFQLEYPELQSTIPHPKQFIRSSENTVETQFRAPLIGEHNAEIYAELGLSMGQVIALKEAKVI
jgi:crotonobetainyl-CoA:carnitine CoA-transferase CaiB-like acyl-CoA transferase